MCAPQRREIVIELEHVRVVRKRATTHLAHCDGCAGESDFLDAGEAARLFEIDRADLDRFAAGSGCHQQVFQGGDTHVCLTSLLAVLRLETRQSRIELIGGYFI